MDTEEISWIRKMEIAMFYGRQLFVTYHNFMYFVCGSLYKKFADAMLFLCPVGLS